MTGSASELVLDYRAAAFEIETARLRIRILSEGDEALFCNLYTDVETMRFIGPPLSRERAARSFRKALGSADRRPLERIFLTLTERATQESIGICSIQQIDTRYRRAEVGIMLNPTSRARGIGKETLIALCRRVFDILPVDEVWTQMSADHSVAERGAISVGLIPSGRAAKGDLRRTWAVHRETWFQGIRGARC